MNKMQASHMLARAERIAGLPKLERGLWHAYRRAWASERKHLPATDVQHGGGWRDLATMQRSYQRPDPATTLRAIENEGSGGGSGDRGPNADTPPRASADGPTT
jgi:hypothetical protein